MISPGELTHEIVKEHHHWLLGNAGDANEVDACRQCFDRRIAAWRRSELRQRVCASINRRSQGNAAKREAAQIETAVTGRPIDPTLIATAIPKIIDVKLTSMEAWVILRALAEYDAREEKTPSAKDWIAERILKLVQPR